MPEPYIHRVGEDKAFQDRLWDLVSDDSIKPISPWLIQNFNGAVRAEEKVHFTKVITDVPAVPVGNPYVETEQLSFSSGICDRGLVVSRAGEKDFAVIIFRGYPIERNREGMYLFAVRFSNFNIQ